MGMDLPLPAIRGQLASAIDLIIHLGRLRDRSRKLLERKRREGRADHRQLGADRAALIERQAGNGGGGLSVGMKTRDVLPQGVFCRVAAQVFCHCIAPSFRERAWMEGKKI